MPAVKKPAVKKVAEKKAAAKSTTAPVTEVKPQFGPAAFEFYEGLVADNSKAYWEDHKAIFTGQVKAPMESLLSTLEPEFGAWHIFRPYRDVRFSKDKSPYKEHMGGYCEIEDSVGFYVQVNAEGLMAGGGWWRSTPGQIARYREAVAGPDGVEFAKLVAALVKAGQPIDGETLKSVPRGYDPEHPRADLLRHKTIVFGKEFPAADWMDSPKLLKTVQQSWRTCRPVLEWLAQHVGPMDEFR